MSIYLCRHHINSYIDVLYYYIFDNTTLSYQALPLKYVKQYHYQSVIISNIRIHFRKKIRELVHLRN